MSLNNKTTYSNKIISGIGIFLSFSIAAFVYLVLNFGGYHLLSPKLIDVFKQITSHGKIYFIWPAIFTIFISILIKRLNKCDKNTAKYVVITQFSLCLMWVGKVFFVTGGLQISQQLFHLSINHWGATLPLIFVTAVTYPIYNSPADRFASTLFVFLSILGMDVISRYSVLVPQEMCMGIFIFFLVASAWYLHGKEHIKEAYIPIRYSVLVALSITLLITSIWPEFNSNFGKLQKNLYRDIFINALFSLSLICLILKTAKNNPNLKRKIVITGIVVACILGLISTPSVCFSLSLILLGYEKKDKFISYLGFSLIPLFIFFYLYHLPIIHK